MSIITDEKNRLFTLHTRNSTYQMKADSLGTLLHIYYGKRIDDSDMSYLIVKKDRGFSGNPYECGMTDKTYSLDVLPQEYSCYGTGDYRISALKVQNEDGSYAASLTYQGYQVHRGVKYAIPGLPAVYVENDKMNSRKSAAVDSLEITLKDEAAGIEVVLYYGVLEEYDVITRAVKIVNKGSQKIILQKAASMNMDWVCGDYEWLTFYGRHNHERNLQRSRLDHGIHAIGSVRGTSSHHYNPFIVVCEQNTDETKGQCFGFSFLYSGEFLMEAEKDQVNQTRLICGIHPDNFAWNLQPGDEFHTPEIMMTASETGFGTLSRNFHRTIREHVCRGEWQYKRRPVLINNWEATYFNFTGEQLVNIAKGGSPIGCGAFRAG